MKYHTHLSGVRCPALAEHTSQREKDERAGLADVAEQFGEQRQAYSFGRVRKPRPLAEQVEYWGDRLGPEYHARDQREYEIGSLFRSHLTVPEPETRVSIFDVTCPTCLVIVAAWCTRRVSEAA